MINRFGNTFKEVEKTFGKIIKFKNQNNKDTLDMILTKTIYKFSKIVKENKTRFNCNSWR